MLGLFSRQPLLAKNLNVLVQSQYCHFAVAKYQKRETLTNQKRRLRKFGMKWHFYDHLNYEESTVPTEQ